MLWKLETAKDRLQPNSQVHPRKHQIKLVLNRLTGQELFWSKENNELNNHSNGNLLFCTTAHMEQIEVEKNISRLSTEHQRIVTV